MPTRSLQGFFVLLFTWLTTSLAIADTHWPQFRGPNGSGSTEAKGLPLTWSDQENVVWKTELKGRGSSSPVVWGDRIFVTCYTGFGPNGGEQSQLERHLVCVNRKDGTILWTRTLAPELPEQERIRENHGYASSTPVVDAERVYVFFGKSGVFAFDHEGQQKWKANAGSNLNGWGSATSPVLHNDLLLVNASVESGSLIALDRRTGREIWRANGMNDSWHAPVLLQAPGDKTEIVMAMPKQLVGLDPLNGEQLWRCDTGIHWYMCPTPVTQAGIVYAIGGRTPNGALAVRAGGRGDVTETHRLWKVTKGSNVPSPILHNGHLYFAHENLGIVYCLDAKTGQLIYEERLEPSPGQIYASPLLANERIYYVGRGGRAVVVSAKPKFERLADNVLEGGRGVFNASLAATGNHLLLRSDKYLYCLGQK